MNVEQNKDDRRHYSENGAAAIAAAPDILLVIYSVAVKSETNQAACNPAGVISACQHDLIPYIAVLLDLAACRVDLCAVRDCEENLGVKARLLAAVCVRYKILPAKHFERKSGLRRGSSKY